MNPSPIKTSPLELTVPSPTKPQRLDSYLGNHPDIPLTRTQVQKFIETGLIVVNNNIVSKKYKVLSGDKITITLLPHPPTEIKGENLPLDIVYEDDFLAVINKPSGMVTHPGVGNKTGTLVNALLYHFQKLSHSSDRERPGIVHRLDKNTSGLLLIAKDDQVYLKLQQALQKREIKRTYLALICGHLKEDKGIIDLPIGRSLKNRKKMTVTNLNSRQAITHYQLLERYRSYDLLEVTLQTGRTHQIRVHFSHLGHPIFGDSDYGGREKWHRGLFAPERPLAKKLLATISRQALHAFRLEFIHPITGEKCLFEKKVPDDFKAVLDILKKEGS